MPKFRKKPVVVDVEQWFPGKDVAGVHVPSVREEAPSHYVITAHGQRAYLAVGDWIIAEPDGRGFYPCKPDIFAATYEALDA